MTEGARRASPARTGEPKEFKSKIAARIRERAALDHGTPDSLRRAVLTLVGEERYESAVEELRTCIDSKPEYPQFKVRCERYVDYAVGLVNGIKAKRSFPGVQMLAMAKQQELYERAMSHFNDLRVTLKKIEQIDHEVRLEDIRSTVWVVKAVVYSITAVLALAFLIEISRGVMGAANLVLEGAASDSTNWIFDKLGL